MPFHYWGCYILLAAAFFTDIRTMKIPNIITILGVVTGLIYHMIFAGFAGLLFSLKGAAGGLGLMLILYFIKAVGGGDVKLFGAIGAWMGLPLTLSMLMYSILSAGCIGIIILFLRREAWRRMYGILQRISAMIMMRSLLPVAMVTKQKEPLTFPFMLAVLPGATLAIYYY